MNMQTLSALGGILAMLVFWHFPADWLFQSHKEALAKSKDWLVRARHCVVYTALYWPLFLLVNFHGLKAGLATVILYVSHYIIDSYIPVMLWAKYLRRAPQFADVVPPVTLTKEQLDALLRGEGSIVGVGWTTDRDRITYKNDEEAFKAMAATNLGLLLMIVMDQFFHICFLIPVAWLMMP